MKLILGLGTTVLVGGAGGAGIYYSIKSISKENKDVGVLDSSENVETSSSRASPSYTGSSDWKINHII